MDHSVKAMTSHRKVAFSRLFDRHRFENSELEFLFRRYILRVQHASISSAVALFVVLTAALATVSFVQVQAPTLANLYHSLHCCVFVILFIVLCTRAIEDLYLNYVCYTIILFSTAFCVVAFPSEILNIIINTIIDCVTCSVIWAGVPAVRGPPARPGGGRLADCLHHFLGLLHAASPLNIELAYINH